MAIYYQPTVSNTPLTLNDIRFELTHNAPFINKNDPDIEGPHIHDCYEMYINVTGDVSFLVDNCLYPVKSGDIILSKPNVFHHCIYNKSCITEHFVLWIHSKENSPFFKFTKNKNFIPRLAFDDITRKNLLSILYQLKNALTTQTELSKISQTACLLQFLTAISTNENVSNVVSPSLLPKNFQAILNDINTNFLNYHSIEDIATAFFISPATLNRWFRMYIHLSPKEFLDGKKLSYAKELLKQGHSVTEAGNEAGFFDTSHFIAVFKKKFNETPFQYKQRFTLA